MKLFLIAVLLFLSGCTTPGKIVHDLKDNEVLVFGRIEQFHEVEKLPHLHCGLNLPKFFNYARIKKKHRGNILIYRLPANKTYPISSVSCFQEHYSLVSFLGDENAKKETRQRSTFGLKAGSLGKVYYFGDLTLHKNYKTRSFELKVVDNFKETYAALKQSLGENNLEYPAEKRLIKRIILPPLGKKSIKERLLPF